MRGKRNRQRGYRRFGWTQRRCQSRSRDICRWQHTERRRQGIWRRNLGVSSLRLRFLRSPLLFGTIAYPMESRVKTMRFFWSALLCTITCAVELSVLRGVPVSGFLCPSYCSVVQIGTSSLAMMNIPPYVASAADNRTIFMIRHRTNIGPFRGGS